METSANALYAFKTKVCKGNALVLEDGTVLYQLVGEVMAHQDYDA